GSIITLIIYIIKIFSFIIFLMSFANNFITFFSNNECYHFVHNFIKTIEILFVQIYLVLFVMERPIFISKFFTFCNGQIVIPCLCCSNIKKVGSPSGTQYF